MMYNIVIDANVLVAGLRSRQGTSFRLLQLLGDDRFALHVSVPVALEYEDVLKRDFMGSSIKVEDVHFLLDYLFSVANLILLDRKLTE